MNEANTTLTIKTPKKLRDEAKKVADALGVPLTTAINAMLRQFVRDRRLVLVEECSYTSHTPNLETRATLREASDSQKRAKIKGYTTAQEMFDDILGK